MNRVSDLPLKSDRFGRLNSFPGKESLTPAWSEDAEDLLEADEAAAKKSSAPNASSSSKFTYSLLGLQSDLLQNNFME